MRQCIQGRLVSLVAQYWESASWKGWVHHWDQEVWRGQQPTPVFTAGEFPQTEEPNGYSMSNKTTEDNIHGLNRERLEANIHHGSTWQKRSRSKQKKDKAGVFCIWFASS